MALSFDAKKNFAYSVIAVAPAPAASGTSLQVAPGDGAKFPAVPFNAVVWPTGVQPTTTNAEVIRVTNRSTDTLTITRAQESSVARSILLNDQIAVNITVKALTDIESAFQTASATTTPVGTLAMWLTGAAPTGWVFLQGQNISRTTYSELFSLWGTTFGAGDGVTTFGVPDMQQRIPIGKTAAGTLATLGAVTGTWDHTHGPGTLTVSAHTHTSGTLTVASHTHDSGTLQVASHTHGPGTLAVASHTHGPGTLSTDNVNLAHSHNAPSHTHTYSGTTDASGSWTETSNSGFGLQASISSHTHAYSGTTDSGGGGATDSALSTHSHNVDFGASDATAPAVNAGLTASTAPSVNSGSTGSTAPSVTGGATGSANPTVGSGVTAAANPPVIVVNFMVRAQSTV